MGTLITFIIIFCILNFLSWRDPEFKAPFLLGVFGLIAASVILTGGLYIIGSILIHVPSTRYIAIFVGCCILISAIIRTTAKCDFRQKLHVKHVRRTTQEVANKFATNCRAKHTMYQPSNAEWKCPECGETEHFYTETPDPEASDDCELLHSNDIIHCVQCGNSWTGTEIADIILLQKRLLST